MPPTKNHRLTRIGPVLMDAGELAEMRVLAEQHDRTLSGEIRYAIGLYCEQARRQQAARAAQAGPQHPSMGGRRLG